MTAFYNEIDPYAAAWLRNLIAAGLIAPGVVDERDIRDIEPDELRGYVQCHFFAGIGGWSRALRLAGWGDSRPVWTGSCPCQPFSSASRGRGEGQASDKHLWPHWLRLIDAARPPVVFGEQVASAGYWLDEVWGDMEGIGYAFWPTVLPAGAVGADHKRERVWLVGYANRKGEPGLPKHGEVARVQELDRVARDVVSTDGLSARVAVLRAFGNAIVPQVAAEFIGAAMTPAERHSEGPSLLPGDPGQDEQEQEKQ